MRFWSPDEKKMKMGIDFYTQRTLFLHVLDGVDSCGWLITSAQSLQQLDLPSPEYLLPLAGVFASDQLVLSQLTSSHA